ncbi:ABC transporter ATP-binding protein [Variovorax sp. LjRoot84]|uniref:ABC transporter ATP-binding protein n=1 Tax=Variovorax sp. LjRoot84 TaxID=3342340 RepID=UPI003F5158C2
MDAAVMERPAATVAQEAARSELLAIENLEVLYAKVILALKGVNLRVEEGRCTVLLGPNGAGKSTTLKAISGILSIDDGAVSAGSIRFGGQAITGLAALDTVARGLIHVVEGRKVLRHLNVEQNLVIGGHLLPGMASVRERLEFVYETIPRLAELRDRTSGYLSGGEQQQLLIGRALMGKPRLMLIDEPSLGLAPKMIEEIFALLAKLKTQGLSLLIVEQNAQAALGLADHGYVMEGGRVVLEAPAEQLRANEDIQEFYLGVSVAGERKNYRATKHYRRRKRWLG